MAILSSAAIRAAINRGDIVITPFDPVRLNPNSVNLTLAPVLRVYDGMLDLRRKTPTRDILIPETGYTLSPGVLYLASTVEYTETRGYVPCLEGRSSWARLGVSIHRTAGFGDHGFCGTWTLEIDVVQPVTVYAGMPCCQIIYHTLEGRADMPYRGRYQGQSGPTESRLHMDCEA